MDTTTIIISIIAGVYGIISVYMVLQSGTTSRFQRQRIEVLDKTIKQFTLVSLAYKASKEVNPTTGPAVLQQLGKVDQVKELELGLSKEPTRTGISIRQGTGLTLKK